MATDFLTQDGGTLLAKHEQRAFLVVHVEGEGPDSNSSRVIDLPDGIDVTFGRSRGSTFMLEHEKVSRNHARIRRTGEQIEIEDLKSRNGVRVNGNRIEGILRIHHGDEIAIGPIIAIVGVISGLPRPTAVVDADAGEARLRAEIDRAVRYHRYVTLALLRVAHDSVIDAIASSLRPMDLVAEDAGPDYLVILPELDRAEGLRVIDQLVEQARAGGTAAMVSTALAPEDGTSVETLIGHLRSGMRTGRAPSEPPVTRGQPIVRDAAMQRVYSLVDRIADSPMTVLILGETGVGKELVAEAIHQRSSRRDKPLIKLNCAALPENLLESELFGHEKGAFTGADKRKVGFFEASEGGTLFLDEIGEMPLTLQAKLLRVLERKTITRVGDTAEIAVDTRLVAATHRDLEGEVRLGRFRQDLLFRIGGFTLVVPPLRDRPAEIVALAEHFVTTTAEEHGRRVPTFSTAARAALASYGWPGNVRELRNAIERALVLCNDVIDLVDLPEKLRDAGHRVRPVPQTAADVRGQLAEVERAAIVGALEAESHNQTRAARRLGLSRRALIYKMEKYGLKPPPSRPG
jgi:two-component system response regulator AtoC